MHRNKLWICFLVFLFAVTIWGVWRIAPPIYDYLRYSQSVKGRVVESRTVESSDGSYILLASYYYMVAGEKHVNEAPIVPFSFKNPWAAEKWQQANLEKDKVVTVWCASTDPAQSRLVRVFPIKSMVYGSLLLLLMGYFLWLGYYVGRQDGLR